MAGDEWTLVESRMQTLGVSHFTVEGKPGGLVVFACSIPVAGQQVVSERFEAEAESVLQAAQAAIQRIVLWREPESCLMNARIHAKTKDIERVWRYLTVAPDPSHGRKEPTDGTPPFQARGVGPASSLEPRARLRSGGMRRQVHRSAWSAAQ